MARDTSLIAYQARVLSGMLDGVNDKVFAFIQKHYNDNTDLFGNPYGVCPEQALASLNIKQSTLTRAFSILEQKDKVIYRVAVRPNITTGLPVGWYAPRTSAEQTSVPKVATGSLYLLLRPSGACSLEGPFVTEEERARVAKGADTPDYINLRIKSKRLVFG